MSLTFAELVFALLLIAALTRPSLWHARDLGGRKTGRRQRSA